MQISKEQLQTIIDNAPAGTDKVGVIEGLYAKGVTVDGVDSYEAERFISQYRSSQMQQANQEQTQLEALATQEDINLGTGFNPSFESEEDDGVIESIGKAIGNLPKSTYMLGKDVVTAVANPIETTKTIATLMKGTGGKLGEKVLENTGFGQAIIGKLNDIRVSNGAEPFQQDANGNFQLNQTEEMELANQVGAYFTDRYGSWENFRESAVEDPAGVLSDVASVVSGAGFAVKQAGNASRVSRISDIGSTIQRVGDAAEPVTAITRGVSQVGQATANTLPGRIVGEAAPTPGRFAEGEIVKALDLTAGDVARISQKTGNDVTDFIARNNLLRETPEEIAIALDSFKDAQYAAVRSEVGKVTNVYNKTDVPRVENALSTVRDTVSGIPGLEDVATEVNRLLAQDTYSLSDIQRVKEILDQNTNIYTRSGDTKSAATAQGLDKVRSELRSFIESEVSKATDGQTDIARLNNDVATSKELVDAIELRQTRGQTRQWNTVFDGILGVTVYGATGDLLTAGLVVAGKKVAQTPSFRIALARTLKATPVEDINRWSKEIAEGNISPQTRQALAAIVEEARRNAEFIEAGSQIVNEATASSTAQTEPEAETTTQ